MHAAAAELELGALVPSGPLFELASAAFVEAARFCSSVDPACLVPPLTGWQLVALIVVAGCLMLDAVVACARRGLSRRRCSPLA